MANLSQIPPWLNINPVADYMAAIQAGAHTGLAISQMQQRAQEHAAELAAQREQAAARQQLAQAQMEQATRYHQAVLGQRQAELAEKTRYEAARNAIDMAREQIALRKEQSSSEQMTKRLDMQDKALEMRGKQLDLQNSMRQTGLDFQKDRLDEMARHNRSMEGRMPKGPTRHITLRDDSGTVIGGISGVPVSEKELAAAQHPVEQPGLFSRAIDWMFQPGVARALHGPTAANTPGYAAPGLELSPPSATPDETDETNGTNIKAQFEDWLKQRNSR